MCLLLNSNRKKTGARLFPCLTPEVDVKKASLFSIPNFIVMFVYIF